MVTKTRKPLVILMAAVVLAGGGLYATSTTTRNEDRRVVRFYAHWKPTYVKAMIIKAGRVGDLETWRNENPTFEKTRNMNKGETAVLEVLIPQGKEVTDLRCYIKVGAEAPKWGIAEDDYCRVDKYVG